MKRLLPVIAFAVCTSVFASDVHVSINVGQPGYYGPIDVAGYPRPRLVQVQPVVVQGAPVSVAPEPLYLHVPPGHAKNWRKHCRKYDACGRPVFFVRDDWYRNVYVPRYAAARGHGGHDEHRKGKKEH